ncbi:twin-arginine translocase subunit TatC [Kangiella sp. HZ709]|uniref:twin-arginine translocase subunit TatC n=1 Tax=Kangiella sp. HZ709 TaxID=2666328 RepID=UPI0012B04E01|nr:twin-arginine translocase subunit TatC [Kangiella sp. HZ709]MRX28256.1 twin-arginine translocase subunit TatC [Kangiella sp. HZ709]
MSPQESQDIDMPLVSHLVELRDRLLRVVLVVGVIFIVLAIFANRLYELLSIPLSNNLPENSQQIATGVISPFLAPLKLAFVTAVFLAIPVILHQAWGFVSPGLYAKEKRFAFPLLFSSVFLFYAGIAFAYFVILPILFQFLPSIAPDGVVYMPDITSYLDVSIKLFFAFGLAFQVPIITLLLIWSGISNVESLAKKRPYIVVGAFIFGMLLTPPDVISQTLLAIPMWLLFEVGLIFGKAFPAKKEETTEDSQA